MTNCPAPRPRRRRDRGAAPAKVYRLGGVIARDLPVLYPREFGICLPAGGDSCARPGGRRRRPCRVRDHFLAKGIHARGGRDGPPGPVPAPA
jgi:hypothetical protein